LIGPTMPRDSGTSAGAPGSQKVFCMSITTSAVAAGRAGRTGAAAAPRDHAVDDLLRI
jgi:hypothetical protein